MPPKKPDPHSVFLNVPFDEKYEKQLIALVATIVSVGRTPHCVLEIPEVGKGRLARPGDIIAQCSVSIHDLSRVGMPVRFNMPFELGLACSLAMRDKRYSFILLEAKPYRSDKTLSDLKGRDPLIHGGNVRGTIACVCDALPTRNGPRPDDVYKIYRELRIVAETQKKIHSQGSIYGRSIFLELVAAAVNLCVRHGIIS